MCALRACCEAACFAGTFQSLAFCTISGTPFTSCGMPTQSSSKRSLCLGFASRVGNPNLFGKNRTEEHGHRTDRRLQSQVILLRGKTAARQPDRLRETPPRHQIVQRLGPPGKAAIWWPSSLLARSWSNSITTIQGGQQSQRNRKLSPDFRRSIHHLCGTWGSGSVWRNNGTEDMAPTTGRRWVAACEEAAMLALACVAWLGHNPTVHCQDQGVVSVWLPADPGSSGRRDSVGVLSADVAAVCNYNPVVGGIRPLACVLRALAGA